MVKYRQIILDNQHWVVGNGHDINIFEDSLVLDVHPLRTWVLHSKITPVIPSFLSTAFLFGRIGLESAIAKLDMATVDC